MVGYQKVKHFQPNRVFSIYVNKKLTSSDNLVGGLNPRTFTLLNNANNFDYMKKATIAHMEVVRQYFKDGVEITPTDNEKLLHSIYGDSTGMTVVVNEFKTDLAVVHYKNGKELAEGFWAVAVQFEPYIHSNDLIIVK